MKKTLTIFLSLVLCLSLIGSISAAYDEKLHQPPVSSDVVIPFEHETEVFTTMLNKNFLYNEAFVSDADLIEGTMLSIMDEAVEGRLLKNRVAEFMLDFYGVTMNENAYDANYIAGEYFYYIPKGFNKAEHVITSIDYDGECYTVCSTANFSAHDAQEEPIKVTSTFIKNENSTFGFNLLNCTIEE